MSESFHSSIRFRKFLRDRIFRLGKRTIYKIIFLMTLVFRISLFRNTTQNYRTDVQNSASKRRLDLK
ncbi:hypothetical protein LEP1GSC165_0643 [Leptospira santarosai str. CBC523]|nr:hypothetical protein LEP1GSC165_0643 [Leptospira santarosai str. CBC523]